QPAPALRLRRPGVRMLPGARRPRRWHLHPRQGRRRLRGDRRSAGPDGRWGVMASLHVALLRGINVGGKNALPMKDLAAMFVEVGCREVNLRLPQGMGRTKLTNEYFEAKLGAASTARNWRTVTMLRDMTNR